MIAFSDGVDVGSTNGVAAADGVGVGVGVGSTDGVTTTDGVAAADGVGVGVGVGSTDGVTTPDGVGVGVGVGVGSGLDVASGVVVAWLVAGVGEGVKIDGEGVLPAMSASAGVIGSGCVVAPGIGLSA